MDITKGLNKEQKEAVKSERLTTLILAGAGTGKTKVLTSRIAYLYSLGVELSSILAVTFTNKAAKEMKERTIKIISELNNGCDFQERDLSIGTFHSICNSIIRRHYDSAFLNKDFQIIDQDEQKSLIKSLVIEKLEEGKNIKDKKEKNKLINNITNKAIKLINEFKDNEINPDSIESPAELLKKYKFDVKRVYVLYEEEKDRLNVLDFGDLILKTVELLQDNPTIKKYYNDRFRHILVDEFQDTNTIQFKLIELLYKKDENYLFVVGDDDQSIYEWRGAKTENILNFDKKYKDTLVVRLEQNYRSTVNILDCANKLIGNNKKRMGKNLWSEKTTPKKVSVNYFDNGYREAEFVAKEIKGRIKKGDNPSDFAILYRSNFISRIMESKLSENQIAYTVIGGVGYWSRMEIKDAISYLSLSINKKNDLAFDRIINLPSRKIGPKKLEEIKRISIENNCSKFEALKYIVDNKLFKGAVFESASNFISIMDNKATAELSLSDKIGYILEESGLINYYLEKDGDEKGEEREQNLMELINAAEFFVNEDLTMSDETAFISYAMLQSSADKKGEEDSVLMMTVHASKGLEFKNVYLIGWEEGIFPNYRVDEDEDFDKEEQNKKTEEERRLAYVAITRAENELSISCGLERFKGKVYLQSRFFNELPKDKIIETDHSNNSPNYYNQNRQVNTSKVLHLSSFRIGQEYENSKYGKGVVVNVVNLGEKSKVTVNFKGLIGLKSFFVENK